MPNHKTSGCQQARFNPVHIACMSNYKICQKQTYCDENMPRANISIAHKPKCKHSHLAYLPTCEMPINLPLCYALVCCAMLCCAMCPLVGAVDCTAIQPLPALPRQSCLLAAKLLPVKHLCCWTFMKPMS